MKLKTIIGITARAATILCLSWDSAMAGVAARRDIAQFDRAHPAAGITVTNGVKWIDGKLLPLEGRAFDNTRSYYDRLPVGISTNVNGMVRGVLTWHTAGMQFRFSTNSRKLVFKWKPAYPMLSRWHWPEAGVSGIDVYRFDGQWGKWLHEATGKPKFDGGELAIRWTPGTPCLVNLPLYNGVKEFALGVEPNAKVCAIGPRRSGIGKPVVFYGTSITQGGCASRPGMSFVNIVGRNLDVPVVNLGFSGSGYMEYELSEVIARIDASCYVLDCLTNMDGGKRPKVKDNYEPFIRNLRRLRPDVPIVMAGMPDVRQRGPNGKDRFVKSLYDRLVAEGWKNLVWLPKEEMFTDDFDGTVDGTHANDYGMTALAKGYGDAVRKALRLSVPSAQQ